MYINICSSQSCDKGNVFVQLFCALILLKGVSEQECIQVFDWALFISSGCYKIWLIDRMTRTEDIHLMTYNHRKDLQHSLAWAMFLKFFV